MGCIFYYALTARDPFGGENVEAIAASHLNAQVDPVAGPASGPARHRVCEWVMRLLSRRPEDRPGSVVEALLGLPGALFADLPAP